MPYTINWYIENEILYTHCTGVMTADELYESLIKTKELIESSPRHLVHIIIDVGDLTEYLKPKESLSIIRHIGLHPRQGWTIVFREKSAMVRLGFAFATSVFKTRNRVFDTIEETEEFLKKVDSTISWDKADKSIVTH